MIGQIEVKNKLINLYNENKLPKVIILSAPEGFGKKEFIKWFANTLDIPYKIFNNSIDDIREAIEMSQNQFTTQIYAFDSIEQNNATQNKVAQNSILKLLEEPPLNVFIFLLCKDSNLLLSTVKSRGIEVKLTGYTREELSNFNSNALALDIFNCPKDLIDSKDIDIEDLVNNVNKIVDKLDIASISNALKLNSYVKIKNKDGEYDKKDGYDINLFIKALRYSFFKKYKETKDEKIRLKFNLLQKALNHLKSNSKYFMDTFIISNYKEVKQWK